MITCPDCQQSALEGTLFCPNCGAPLQIAVNEGKTETIPFVDTPSVRAEPPLVGKETRDAGKISSLRFIIPGSGRQVSLPLLEQIRIGRADELWGTHPELDLTDDGGIEAGVSRMHAAILSTPQGIAIMDLSSVNGTQVNGYPIPSNLPYALNSGDEIKLGDLLIHVFFKG